jgi:general L-amino acid transport system substrate-binding protein
MKSLSLIAAGSFVAVLTVATAAGAATLDDVKARGTLNCGVTTGDDTKVNYVPTNAKERFTALQSGEIDLLARNTTWTFSRDTDLGFEFVGTNYYDGQGFMVRKSLAVSSALELNGASVCVQTGTTTEKNLADYFRSNNLELKSVVFETNEQARQSYDEGRCDAYTTDASGLAAERSVLSVPDDHIILPEIISKEPLGPLVRHGDNAWGDIVRWTLNAMVIAEEFGITQANVDEMKSSDNPEVRRLLGVEDKMAAMIGLNDDWAYNIVKLVGNYGESFEANVGLKTPLGLARGLNQLWSKGGILYAPPFR